MEENVIYADSPFAAYLEEFDTVEEVIKEDDKIYEPAQPDLSKHSPVINDYEARMRMHLEMHLARLIRSLQSNMTAGQVLAAPKETTWHDVTFPSLFGLAASFLFLTSTNIANIHAGVSSRFAAVSIAGLCGGLAFVYYQTVNVKCGFDAFFQALDRYLAKCVELDSVIGRGLRLVQEFELLSKGHRAMGAGILPTEVAMKSLRCELSRRGISSSIRCEALCLSKLMQEGQMIIREEFFHGLSNSNEDEEGDNMEAPVSILLDSLKGEHTRLKILRIDAVQQLLMKFPFYDSIERKHMLGDLGWGSPKRYNMKYIRTLTRQFDKIAREMSTIIAGVSNCVNKELDISSLVGNHDPLEYQDKVKLHPEPTANFKNSIVHLDQLLTSMKIKVRLILEDLSQTHLANLTSDLADLEASLKRSESIRKDPQGLLNGGTEEQSSLQAIIRTASDEYRVLERKFDSNYPQEISLNEAGGEYEDESEPANQRKASMLNRAARIELQRLKRLEEEAKQTEKKINTQMIGELKSILQLRVANSATT
ncbi:hypothetical protein HDU76_001942 [Blyttiomyces sp. JEL0837]|nr:hypothetical protein HDU76_001942 [Blyttiomyces sp. JEL0837]